MDSKRLAIAFLASAVILIVWTALFPPPKPQRPPAAPGATLPVTSETPAAEPVRAATPVAAGAEVPAAAAVRVEPIGGAEERHFVVSSSLFTARLTNRGGDLLSFRLRRFKDSKGEELDLVRRDAPFAGRTLRLDGQDAFLKSAAQGLHDVKVETKGLETALRFRYREANGSGVTRTYTFGQGYTVGLLVEREGAAGPLGLVLGPGIGNPSAEELENRYTKPGSTVELLPGGSVERRPKDGLKAEISSGKGLIAAGLEDNYFLFAFLPGPEATSSLRPVTLTGAQAAAGTPGAPLVESEVILSGRGRLLTDLYFGPKDIEILQRIRPGMDRLIDYGWFAILVKPLLFTLKGIHGAVPNWGVAIILITVLIKVLLFPLTYKQLVSMKKMSLLQPKVEAVRVKWAPKMKQDPQARVKMNEEMMAIYKTEGVNPAGGCLPLVLQMPILIAFYNLLAHAIELRHAPFALWITDLSVKDAYYVTPVLMTATMWIQQQMTPATGDATTRRVMAFMPLVFGFMFKDMPAGLVLYWLAQNLLTIGQQLLLERYTDLGLRPGAKKA